MTPIGIVNEFWGHTTQGAKLCTMDDLIGLVAKSMAEEREACAKLADDLAVAFKGDRCTNCGRDNMTDQDISELATEIRNRNK